MKTPGELMREACLSDAIGLVKPWDAVEDVHRQSWDEIAARYDAAREAEAWRPMEEAPKDGTKILIAYGGAYPGSPSGMCVAHWHEADEEMSPSCWKIGWKNCISKGLAWRPLPAPPAKEAL